MNEEVKLDKNTILNLIIKILKEQVTKRALVYFQLNHLRKAIKASLLGKSTEKIFCDFSPEGVESTIEQENHFQDAIHELLVKNLIRYDYENEVIKNRFFIITSNGKEFFNSNQEMKPFNITSFFEKLNEVTELCNRLSGNNINYFWSTSTNATNFDEKSYLCVWRITYDYSKDVFQEDGSVASPSSQVELSDHADIERIISFLKERINKLNKKETL
jgi:hypothetical protein